jgi:glycosyltransferase involved in cell wall biosynthesis
MKILFVVPYPLGEAPSQRYRFEHYLDYLSKNKIQYTIRSFWSNAAWKILYSPGSKHIKVYALICGLFRRLLLLFNLTQIDIVYIHREATPIGPPWFEWLVVHLFRKKTILDFDDAIWIPAVSSSNSFIRPFRNHTKTNALCKWANKISVGNEFLATYASQFNKNVTILPTVVNTRLSHNKIQNHDTFKPSIGWTGTSTTLKYLFNVMPVLIELENKYNTVFTLICDIDPILPLKNYRFIKWTKDTEIEDLLNIHIGLMPLTDDELSKGKCGFKAIQYLSLGIPAVVSPVGVNKNIVLDGVHGFHCNDLSQWRSKLELLLINPDLRTTMGNMARARIETNYSVHSTEALFESTIKFE